MEGKREYRPRDIGRKYGGNDLRGRRNLKAGTIKEWSGDWPESWRTAQDAAFFFPPQSEQEVWERATLKVEELAEKRGIGLWLAGRDYPLHSGLQSGSFAGLEAEREKQSAAIGTDAEVGARVAELARFPLTYKYLLVNGDNITLNAVSIPPEVVAFRDFYMGKLRESGFKPNDMENILHMTIARIKRLPLEHPEEARRQFIQDLIALRHEISSNPIEVTTDHVFVGTNLMRKYRKDL